MNSAINARGEILESKMSGHWTNDEIIAHLYGVGPEDQHLQTCGECQGRLSVLQANRDAVESEEREEVPFEFLAAQRRQIYAKITAPAQSWRSSVLWSRRASAAATVAVLAGGLFVYQQRHRPMAHNEVSDAQLAQEVSCMSENLEPNPTAPLQELFE